jgi:class 3 adenylate cyclase
MAVFRQPASAVRAFQKAQELFFNSDESDLAIRLKGGLHHGSCYAVTLNNRIDYFGNTVNLAARLVEKANRDELIVSSKTFENPHLQSLLDQDDMFCKTDSFSSVLKGFGDKQYTMKRLSLHKPALKLVI